MSFSGDAKKYTALYSKRLDYVAKTATLEVCNEARKVGPSVANPDAGKGGRMPVDSSNLRHSMVGSTEGMPSGPAEGNEGKPGDDVAAALVRWRPGQTSFWAGFTAAYARAMEYKYGFMRGAAERWPDLVNKAAAAAQRLGL